jgi:zinc protease
MFVSAPIASAAEVGAVLADVVQRPDFAEAEVARSRTQTVNALRVNLRQPGPLASLVLNRLIYGAAPYGAPTSGTPESVAAVTREEIVDFHRRWWRPDNAAVIVTGGMEPEAAFAWAEQVLGGWERPTTPKPSLGERSGTRTGPRVVVVDLPGAGQAAVTAAVRGPRRADDSYYSLAVANAVMGSGQNGRLFQEIRAKRGLSYGAYSSLAARAEGGALVASTQTKNESAAEVVGLVLAEFDRLAREPVDEQAVTDRETFITGGFQRALETTGGLGGQLADAVVNGLPLSEIEAYPGRIAATTPESLRAAAGVVSADDAVVVVVGQADMFIDALRAAHPDVVVIPAAELDLDSPTLGL